MKKLKFAVWLVIIGLLGLIIFQNREFFLIKHSLGVNLIYSQYQSPELPTAVFFMVFFLFGWLLAYLFGLGERFRALKTIRRLQETIHSQQNDIDLMKKDVASLKPRIEPADMNTSVQVQTDEDAVSP